MKKNHIIYKPNNNSTHKAQIVKIDNSKYAVVKPLKNKFIKLDTVFFSVYQTRLQSFSHLELRDHLLHHILKNEIDGIELKT